MLRKIEDKYQTYCTMDKIHTMATCHDLNIEDSESTCIDSGNESTHGSDATVTLGGPETEGHPNDPVYNNQEKIDSTHNGDR